MTKKLNGPQVINLLAEFAGDKIFPMQGNIVSPVKPAVTHGQGGHLAPSAFTPVT